MFAWIDIVYMLASGALVWHFKDTFVNWGRTIASWWKGGAAYAGKLEADAKALMDKAAAIKAAVKA